MGEPVDHRRETEIAMTIIIGMALASLDPGLFAGGSVIIALPPRPGVCHGLIDIIAGDQFLLKPTMNRQQCVDRCWQLTWH